MWVMAPIPPLIFSTACMLSGTCYPLQQGLYAKETWFLGVPHGPWERVCAPLLLTGAHSLLTWRFEFDLLPAGFFMSHLHKKQCPFVLAHGNLGWLLLEKCGGGHNASSYSECRAVVFCCRSALKPLNKSVSLHDKSPNMEGLQLNRSRW